MNATFYSPAPYPSDEEQRQRVVTRLLRTEVNLTAMSKLVHEAALALELPTAAVTILDGDRQLLLVGDGISAATTARAVAFCGHTILQEQPLLIADACRDPRFAGNPLVLQGLMVRSYAGVRLLVESQPVGALCAFGSDPVSEFSAEAIGRLQELGVAASNTLSAQLRAAPVATNPCRSARPSKIIALDRFRTPHA